VCSTLSSLNNEGKTEMAKATAHGDALRAEFDALEELLDSGAVEDTEHGQERLRQLAAQIKDEEK
jgi:hypothetical protein